MGASIAAWSTGPGSLAVASATALNPEQEQILAEVIRCGRLAGGALRLAVIPLDSLRVIPELAGVVRAARRAQDHLRRAASQWTRRCTSAGRLAASTAALARDLEPEAALQWGLQPTDLASADGPALLIGALKVDRSLVSDTRLRETVRAFAAALESTLAELDQAFPPSNLARLDLSAAVRAARDFFIRAQMPLAARRARAVARHSRLEYDDLVQTGSEGLIQAVDAFDPRFGVPFAGYGYIWVKQAIARGERQGEIIPLPQRIQAARAQIRRALARASAEGTPVDPTTIAKETGVEPRFVSAVLRAEKPVLSLSGDDGRPLAETQADPGSGHLEERVCRREQREATRGALATCGHREREVLAGFFGIGQQVRPVAEIARRLGVTTQRVYQLKAEALAKLRRPSVSIGLARHLA